MSLQLLQQYSSSDEDEEVMERLRVGESPTNEQAPGPSGSGDPADAAPKSDTVNIQEHGIRSSSSSETETSEDESEAEEECEADDRAQASAGQRYVIKAKGELALDDLPPIEDLAISVPEQECEAVGTIFDIVDQLVIVESFPGKPSLDLETVLFLDNGKTALGHVFDVFGQVTKPFYCVRFNSENHIEEKGIIRGMSVYYAPKTNHTNYVFISELMRLKGTDASWKDDMETPVQYAEYSDDEEERRAKAAAKKSRRDANHPSGGHTSSSHQLTEYEERMNRKNLMKTVECNRSNQTTHRFDPFGHQSEVRWHQHQHQQRFPGYWGWNMALPPSPPVVNVPPFMRAPRFTVPASNWSGHIRSNATMTTQPPASWWSMDPSTAPPGT